MEKILDVFVETIALDCGAQRIEHWMTAREGQSHHAR